MASSVEHDELEYDGGDGILDGPFQELMELDDWIYARKSDLREFSYWVTQTQRLDKLDEAGWDELYCEWLEGI